MQQPPPDDDSRAPARAARLPVDRRLRVLRWISAVLVGAYVALMVTAALGLTDSTELLVTGGYSFFLTSLVGIVTARAVCYRQDRAAWACFAAALASYLVGNVTNVLHYSQQAEVVRPSWADLAFMGFYPLAYVALVLMLRSRVRRVPLSTWLDGVVTGLTAAAFGAAFAVGAVRRPPTAAGQPSPPASPTRSRTPCC